LLGGIFFKLMLTAFLFWTAGECKLFKVADSETSVCTPLFGWIVSLRNFLSRDRGGGGVIKRE